MAANHVLAIQIVFSAIVIALFGYRQFNQWTERESKGDTSDSELLAFAPPRSFTSLWRFLTVASFYWLSLVMLYLVLLVIFRSPPGGGAEFLKVAGVTPDNAWLVALFIVTGLSPIVPVFSDIERALREVMHAWAVVPTKAQQMADELASPQTIFTIDDVFLRNTVLPRLGDACTRGDAVEGRAVTIAQKWCRLNYLLCKFAPPALNGLGGRSMRSPYTTRFLQDLAALDKEVKDFAAVHPDAWRARHGGSPAAVALSDRLDFMLHRLYVLMCCNAFASARSLDEVIRYFQRGYGITVGNLQLAAFPTNPVFDTLVWVGLAVLGLSAAFDTVYPSDKVNPLGWAASATFTHGAGLVVGWLVFVRRRRGAQPGQRGSGQSAVNRKHVVTCIVLGFALASLPTWLGSIQYLLDLTSESAGRPLPELMYRAFVGSWPWALLGSATAVAVFVHLERTSNGQASLALRVRAALLQGTANLVIALGILVLYAPPVLPVRSLGEKFADPVVQLVLLLTAFIGLILGFFLPRIVHGHGLDLRGGTTRYRPQGPAASAVFTCSGRQHACELQAISMHGGVIRLADDGFPLSDGRRGMLSLAEGTALTAYVVRTVEDDADSKVGGPVSYALQFMSRQRPVSLPDALRGRLAAFLRGGDLVAMA